MVLKHLQHQSQLIRTLLCIKPPEWNSFSFKAVRLKKIAPTGSITSVKLASFNIRGWHKSVEAVGRN